MSRLEEIRKQQGLSRAAVAARVGMSERHVYRLERGLSPLKRMHALAFAEAFAVDVAELGWESNGEVAA